MIYVDRALARVEREIEMECSKPKTSSIALMKLFMKREQLRKQS